MDILLYYRYLLFKTYKLVYLLNNIVYIYIMLNNKFYLS